jgi:FkbM family methyltransferase
MRLLTRRIAKQIFRLLKVRRYSISRMDDFNKKRLDDLATKFSNELENGFFVQVGAGAGDLDSRADFKDGFSYIVKKIQPNLIKSILLVEPNMLNLNLLEKSWSSFPNHRIFNIAIVTNTNQSEQCEFFYSKLDGPNFQTCSIDPAHVLKHYPMEDYSSLQSFTVKGISLQKFLRELSGEKIALLSLDIEGIDYEVILETDFSEFDIHFLSLEYIHMGEKIGNILEHLKECGFTYAGLGVDWNGNDILFERVRIFKQLNKFG